VSDASKPIIFNAPRFERIAERKLRRRELTDGGDVEITGRDVQDNLA
jgi:hypothetical protein